MKTQKYHLPKITVASLLCFPYIENTKVTPVSPTENVENTKPILLGNWSEGLVLCFPCIEYCQFLFLCRNWLFLAIKHRNIWIFPPKLLFHNFIWKIGPKSYNTWYILESKIQEYYWILAQKYKLHHMWDFVKIQFLVQKLQILENLEKVLKWIWIFAPKLVKNCHFIVLFGVILGQNCDCVALKVPIFDTF